MIKSFNTFFYTGVRICGLLLFLVFGCGKKGDPIPLYKQPVFPMAVEEKPSSQANQALKNEGSSTSITDRTSKEDAE